MANKQNAQDIVNRAQLILTDQYIDRAAQLVEANDRDGFQALCLQAGAVDADDDKAKKLSGEILKFCRTLIKDADWGWD